MSIEIGDGGLGYIYLGDVLIAGGGGGGSTTHTLDFQNNGLSGCTISSTGVYGVDSGEGIYLTTNSASYYGADITLPSSIFDGKTLKQIKMYGYLPATATSIGFQASGKNFRYKQEYTKTNNIGFVGNTTEESQSIGNITGEIVFTADITSSNISGSVNSTNYSINSSTSNDMIQARSNGELKLSMTNRGTRAKIYIRKVEITTE